MTSRNARRYRIAALGTSAALVAAGGALALAGPAMADTGRRGACNAGHARYDLEVEKDDGRFEVCAADTMARMSVLNRRWVVSLLTAATVAAVAAGAVVGTESTGGPQTPARVSAGGDDAVDQVVVISVDGLNPDAVRKLGAARAPAFHRLMREGATTLNARTLRETSRTLPNHLGMVTGRRATGRGGHGVMVNRDTGGDVHQAAGGHVESMFTVVHDRGGRTALYSAKSKFAFLDRSWDGQRGGADRVGIDEGRDKIDTYVYAEEAQLVSRLTHRLRTDPDELSMVHLALADRAGHAHGFMGASYLSAVRRTDRLIGDVLTTVARDRVLRGHTVVILTADHGGRSSRSSDGHGHSDPSRRANYTVPFMVWGATVARNADLYRLNDSRRNPGRTRTTYAGRQPIRNAEVANLATDLLDVPAVPGSQLNRRQRLQVAR